MAFLYQDLKLLAEEEADQTQEYSSDAELLGGEGGERRGEGGRRGGREEGMGGGGRPDTGV